MSNSADSLSELRRLVDQSLDIPPPDGRSAVGDALRNLALRLTRARALHQQRIDRQAVAVIDALAARETEAERALAALREELAGTREELTRTREELERTDAQLEATRAWLAATSDRGDATAGRVDWVAADAEARATAVSSELSRVVRLVASDDQLGPLEPLTAKTGEAVLGFSDAGPVTDGVYLGFENVFRGSESAIGERQRAYVPLLSGRSPVLDVGCGRGELLELLRAAGIDARGVDLDAAMVRRCRDKGLDVSEDDALSAVAPATGSLGAVVAAQLIEHLPYAELTSFFAALRTALVPEGIVILETVNPHCPQALKQFWIDPTHQHPLFPEVVLALLRLSGFAEGYLWYPQGSGDPERDRREQPDYSIVATTPST